MFKRLITLFRDFFRIELPDSLEEDLELYPTVMIVRDLRADHVLVELPEWDGHRTEGEPLIELPYEAFENAYDGVVGYVLPGQHYAVQADLSAYNIREMYVMVERLTLASHDESPAKVLTITADDVP